MITADELIKLLHLEPLSLEGGFFVETYRSKDLVPQTALPPGYSGARSVCTAIYYLLTPDTFSAIHRLHGDEIFHFYLGDPVEILQLGPESKAGIATLGPDLARGMMLQYVVPGGVWQGSRLREGGRYALLGTTVAPGFDYQDFELGARSALQEQYPQFSSLISQLTRTS
jgi:hypothetical protein